MSIEKITTGSLFRAVRQGLVLLDFDNRIRKRGIADLKVATILDSNDVNRQIQRLGLNRDNCSRSSLSTFDIAHCEAFSMLP